MKVRELLLELAKINPDPDADVELLILDPSAFSTDFMDTYTADYDGFVNYINYDKDSKKLAICGTVY